MLNLRTQLIMGHGVNSARIHEVSREYSTFCVIKTHMLCFILRYQTERRRTRREDIF